MKAQVLVKLLLKFQIFYRSPWHEVLIFGLSVIIIYNALGFPFDLAPTVLSYSYKKVTTDEL